MATHRRGLRPSQWPVRDLLGPDVAPGRLWDARIGAALAGLLACGAAVTVVLTSGDQAVSGQPAEVPGPGEPLALPPPAADGPSPSVPAPHVAVPAPTGPSAAAPWIVPSPGGPMAADPQVVPPRSARPQITTPTRVRRTPTESTARPTDRAVADQVATVIERWDDRSGRDRADSGRDLVPVPRPADGAALLDLACADEHRSGERRTGGRHRAPDEDAEQRVTRYRIDRDDRDGDVHHGRRGARAQDDERSGWDRSERDRHGDRAAGWGQSAHEDTDTDADRDDERSEWDWFATDRDDQDEDGQDAEGDRSDWDWFATDHDEPDSTADDRGSSADDRDGEAYDGHTHDEADSDEADDDGGADRDRDQDDVGSHPTVDR